MTSNVTEGRDRAAEQDAAAQEATGHDPAELGELERSVLQLLWQHGTLSAERVREELAQQDRSLKDSTVRTVLRRLEEKGYLTHILDNRTFLYSPAEPAPMVAGRAVKRILEWFCDGSVEQLLVGMVDSSVLDSKELKRLAERIAAAQTEKKPGGGGQSC
jgi:predicted transcriptional regulator